jgi:hypothetical protein
MEKDETPLLLEFLHVPDCPRPSSVPIIILRDNKNNPTRSPFSLQPACPSQIPSTNRQPSEQSRLWLGTMSRESITTLRMDERGVVVEQISTPGEHMAEIFIAPEVIEQWKKMSIEEREKFEKRLLWKLDLRLVPWLSLVYLLSFLDRANIGNAKLQGVNCHSTIHGLILAFWRSPLD